MQGNCKQPSVKCRLFDERSLGSERLTQLL